MSLSYLPFSFPGVPQVHCAFQMRPLVHGDVPTADTAALAREDATQALMASRRMLWHALRPQGLTAWAELVQVHGDSLVFEPENLPLDTAASTEGDGMATTRLGLGLCIKTADCQPILLTDTLGTHIAALHVGWRGNRCRFPLTAVERFCEHYHLSPADILAVRGPSLGPRRAEFVHFAQEWGPAWLPWFDTASHTMDLWSLTHDQLQQAGLLPRHIYGLDWCTAENTDLFFSWRQEKTPYRQANLIWISTPCALPHP